MCQSNVMQTRHFRTLFVLLAALPLISCVQIRLLTYPADFSWIEKSDVQTIMQAMASRLDRLDELITTRTVDPHNEGDATDPEPRPDAEDTRAMVLTELEGIEALASTLLTQGSEASDTQTDTLRTNHLLLDEHLDDFLSQVNHAIWQVEAEPASYYGVGQLTGNCNACHRKRGT